MGRKRVTDLLLHRNQEDRKRVDGDTRRFTFIPFEKFREGVTGPWVTPRYSDGTMETRICTQNDKDEMATV